MKIVILDAYTTNPGDLYWKELGQLGTFEVYDYTPKEQTIARAKDAEMVITNKTLITKQVIENLPKLKYIGLLSTGCNAVDLEAAAKRGITVCNVPDYCTDSVAQMCFSLLLEITNSVGYHSHSVIKGDWSKSRDFCYWINPICDLSGKTMGIIGFGRTGKRICDIARAFNMNILASTRQQTADTSRDFVKFVELYELLCQSDVIVLACSLNKDNYGLICKKTIELMKKEAIIINTARGPLINDADLADALNSGRIKAAGVDVLSEEPPKSSNPLIGAKNCYITPHIAWASYDSRKRLIEKVTQNVKAFLEGRPINVVNI